LTDSLEQVKALTSKFKPTSIPQAVTNQNPTTFFKKNQVQLNQVGFDPRLVSFGLYSRPSAQYMGQFQLAMSETESKSEGAMIILSPMENQRSHKKTTECY